MNFYDKFTPEGSRDILFEDCVARQKTQNIIMESLYTRGFRPVTTPAMEFYDLFGVNRYFSQESMYKLVDAQGRILVLRPDSTIPIAADSNQAAKRAISNPPLLLPNGLPSGSVPARTVE